jgi:hypothetical protein
MAQVFDIKKILSFLAVLFLLIMPLFVDAANPSAATDAKQTGITYECGDGVTAGDCDFQDLVLATNKVVKFGTTLAVSLSVVVLAWAGFNYMISGDNPGKRTEANKMLKKVLIGIAVMLSAYLIVDLITKALLNSSATNLL